MPVETINWKNNKIKLVDQTKLPDEFKYIYCNNIPCLGDAIIKLKVRGAPAIGIAGALGVLLAARKSKAKEFSKFYTDVNKSIKYLSKTRPTARNLFWALERMKNILVSNKDKKITKLKKILELEALKIVKEDKSICRKMAKYGAALVKNGDNLLTHCNAGGLATADYGTALGVFFEAKRQNKKITVYADETRPLLQGARLTTWELMKAKIKTVLICDNMAASLIKSGKIDKIFVGADRIASNGDAANKIGTYNLAILAKYHKIPFFIVAPKSTFDLSLKSGIDIPIEQRKSHEVTEIRAMRIAPKNVGVWNPAFDVTPSKLITAIITEEGVFRYPYKKSLKKLARK